MPAGRQADQTAHEAYPEVMPQPESSAGRGVTVPGAAQPARLFIGTSLPEHAHVPLQSTLEIFSPHVRKVVPPARWHVTLLFLGAAVLGEVLAAVGASLPQPFVPTLRFIRVGRGLARHQLWAYGQTTPAFEAVRTVLRTRLSAAGVHTAEAAARPFVPHIRLGDLRPTDFLPEVPLRLSFQVPYLSVYESIGVGEERQYNRHGIIQLTV